MSGRQHSVLAQPLKTQLTLLRAGGNPESLLGVGFVVTAASRAATC